MHGEDGQATVEWVALVLVAALVLGATALLAGRPEDRELGELVAKRITGPAPGDRTAPPAPPAPAPRAPRVSASPAPPLASNPRTVDAFRSVRGVSEVAKRAWILCLGYRRWRYELEHPMAPNEVLPLHEALEIANTCFNPYDYLFEE